MPFELAFGGAQQPAGLTDLQPVITETGVGINRYI
jgi:hypothetical protein